jgi:hypothetical protein
MKHRLENAVNKVCKSIDTFSFSNDYLYAFWLSQAYYFVKHSTPMLALSAGLSVENRPYHIRCIEHLSEEKGHDKMLLNDLKQLGYSIEDFPELTQTQALYQTQYYWIQHKSPTSFLGYIVLLEGIAINSGKKVLQQVTTSKGLSFLKLHSEEDEDHIEKAYSIIESMNELEQVLICKNCELSADIYVAMIEQIKSYGSKYKELGLSA